MSSIREIRIEVQGTLVSLSKSSSATLRTGSTRGVITSFSDKSRRRLMKMIARLKPTRATFLTLTYPANYPDAHKAKDHLRALHERIRRRYPEASGIWRLEFQERGAPHFHELYFDLPYIRFSELRAIWREIIGIPPGEPLFVRIERVKSWSGVKHYVSKYLAKTSQDGSSTTLLDSMPYLHAGRFWGVFNRPYLPFAPLVEYFISGVSWKNFYDAKRAMRRIYPNLSMDRFRGGSIYSDNAYMWFVGLVRILMYEEITA